MSTREIFENAERGERMKSEYENGYNAGYKAGLRTITENEAYKKGFREALEFIQGIAQVKLNQRGRGGK